MEQYRVVSLIGGTIGLKVRAKNLPQAVRRAVVNLKEIDLADTEFIEDYVDTIKEVYDIYVYDSNGKRIGDNYLEDGNIYQEHLGKKFFMKILMLIAFGVTGFGALALIIEAKSPEHAVNAIKSVLNLNENQDDIPDEMTLYMEMSEIISLVQDTGDAESATNLYSPIFKWYASFGLPSSWYFIPVGVALGLAINLL